MDENFNHDFAPFVPYGIPTGEKHSILCIMMLHFIPFICDYYAPAAWEKIRERTNRENMSAVWIFKWSKRISEPKPNQPASQPATVSTSATSVCVCVRLFVYVHTVNAPCIIIWKTKCWITKAAQTASIYYNNNINSISVQTENFRESANLSNESSSCWIQIYSNRLCISVRIHIFNDGNNLANAR